MLWSTGGLTPGGGCSLDLDKCVMTGSLHYRVTQIRVTALNPLCVPHLSSFLQPWAATAPVSVSGGMWPFPDAMKSFVITASAALPPGSFTPSDSC
jgi:hypothetical protein